LGVGTGRGAFIVRASDGERRYRGRAQVIPDSEKAARVVAARPELLFWRWWKIRQ
jgi:hypothetical protein